MVLGNNAIKGVLDIDAALICDSADLLTYAAQALVLLELPARFGDL